MTASKSWLGVNLSFDGVDDSTSKSSGFELLKCGFYPAVIKSLEVKKTDTNACVFLNTFYVRDNHLTCEIRVLAHILEVTSVERSAADVDARSQKDVLLAVARLFTDAAAVEEGHFLVPCRCKVDECREGCT